MIDVSIKSGVDSFAINSILSEGEAKIYSFCDWLTELNYDNNNILVFDDPITSLDHNNIEKVVDKITELTKDYQIIVFTHNQEFYHRLLQQTLGGGFIYNSKCKLCEKETEPNQCKGYDSTTSNTHKCSSYYKISSILKPGHIESHVDFFAHNWETRIEIIRKNLEAGNISEADKNIRTTINNFFEKYVLHDIKRVVYKNNDLITVWRKIKKDIEEDDYNASVYEKITSYVENPLKDKENPVIYLYNTHQLETYSNSGFENSHVNPNVLMASYLLAESLNKSNINCDLIKNNIHVIGLKIVNRKSI